MKDHFAEFEASYQARYQEQYGFFRPAIGPVVEKFLIGREARLGTADQAGPRVAAYQRSQPAGTIHCSVIGSLAPAQWNAVTEPPEAGIAATLDTPGPTWRAPACELGSPSFPHASFPLTALFVVQDTSFFPGRGA